MTLMTNPDSWKAELIHQYQFVYNRLLLIYKREGSFRAKAATKVALDLGVAYPYANQICRILYDRGLIVRVGYGLYMIN